MPITERRCIIALTKERRNEIALKYLMRIIAQKPIAVIDELIVGLRAQVPNIECNFARFIFAEIVNSTFTGRRPALCHGINYEEEKKIKTMAWDVLIAWEFKSGINIGELTKRQIGDKAKSLGISNKEAVNFEELVANEIVKRTFR